MPRSLKSLYFTGPMKPPTRAHGKICYLEIPALDIARSSAFYRDVFGWNIRTDDTGEASFDDTVGEVSGMWVLGRPPMSEAGILISIMVDSLERTCQAVVAHGGTLVRPVTELSASERVAHFRDPAGNLFSLYQSSRSNAS